MENSTLIKLRQLESSDVTQNGAYNISLKENVTLEQGDIVKLHTAILDTSTESFITLNEDTPIEMDVANYVRNYKFNHPITQHFQITINDSQPDLNMYYPCFETGISGNEYLVTEVICYAHDDERTDPITLDYSYTDPATSSKATGTINVPSFKGINHVSLGFRVPMNKLISGRDITLLNSDSDLHSHHLSDSKGANGRPFFVVSQTPLPNPSGNEVHNNIFTRTLSFIIPAGRYYPAEIAQIINDQMSALGSIGQVGYNVAENKYPVESPFMNTLHQLNHLVTGSTASGGLDKKINYNPTIPEASQLPTQLMNYNVSALNSATDPVIGANEISLNYDENLRKLNFDALHMPFYVGTGGAGGNGQPGLTYPDIAAKLQPKSGGGVLVPHEPQPSYGGAFFTRLSPTNFWTRQLGFEGLVVTPGTSSQLLTGRTDLSSAVLPDIYPLTLQLTPGQNIVTSFEGLDNIIPKTATAYLPVLGEVSQPLTTPIVSAREFDVPNNDEGYYLIEVGMNIPQKMIGGFGSGVNATTSNKVQGIMGKYFTAGNFLQSQGQGAIVYEHEGDPVLLSDLAVTIRNPDMTLTADNDLGEKNSIFLEVIKQTPAPAPTPSN